MSAATHLLHDTHVTAWRDWGHGQARNFLHRLDPEADGFTFQSFDDTSEKRRELARVAHGDLECLAPRLDAMQDLRAGIFVTVNATDGKGRQAHNIERVRAVFVDLDGAPLAPIMAAGLEPHIVVESSPGKWHCYWLVTDCPLDQFERVQRALARRFNGDPSVHDLSRVMRLPGFRHFKAAPQTSKLLDGIGTTAPAYTLAEIVSGLTLQLDVAEARPQTRANGDGGKIEPGDRHAHLFARGRSMAKGGLSREAVRAALAAENQSRCDPPLAESEIDHLAGRVFTAKDAQSWQDSQVRAEAHASARPDGMRHENGRDAPEDDMTGREWAEPQPIRAELFPVPAFDAEALLPEVLREWVMDEAERMPCAPDFIAAAAIVALGATIGARCAIKPKARDSWLVVPNLWGGVVALPSAKKSPAVAAAMKPLDRLAAQAHEAHRQETEAFETNKIVSEAHRDAIKDALKLAAKKEDGGNVSKKADELRKHAAEAPQPPILRRYRTNDTTVEKLGELLRDSPAGLLVLRDELVGLLASWDKEGREGDRSFFLEAWNGSGSFDTDRIGRGSIFVENLCVSIFGGIQPDKLTEYLELAANALGNDGTLQRFQVLVYPDARPWEWRDRAPNREARDEALKLFELLANGDPVTWGATPADEVTRFPYFRFDDEAQEVFIEWMRELQCERIPREQTDGQPLIAQHLAKYEKLFAALALVLHLTECMATGRRGSVTQAAAIRAKAWCKYLEAHARRCYGLLADEGLRSAQALAIRIQRGAFEDGFTARDVRRHGWRYLSKDAAVQPALDWLEDEGWLRSIGKLTDPNGGRPTVRYQINPKTVKRGGQATANTDKTKVSAVMAVPHPGVSAEVKGLGQDAVPDEEVF